jgi:hypothetical protein
MIPLGESSMRSSSSSSSTTSGFDTVDVEAMVRVLSAEDTQKRSGSACDHLTTVADNASDSVQEELELVLQSSTPPPSR